MNRRNFLRSTLGFFLSAVGLSRGAFARSAGAKPSTSLLQESPFVYISPLLANGQESHCHAELWFAWIDGAVVAIVSRDRWKARAIRSGSTRARIWVGDHGIWRGFLWNNEAFRGAPNFETEGEVVEDAALLTRLLARYETKYPDEIADWRDRMRDGYAGGSRVLVRYTPQGG